MESNAARTSPVRESRHPPAPQLPSHIRCSIPYTHPMLARVVRVLALSLLASAAAHGQTGSRAEASFCARVKALTAAPPVAQAHWGISVATLDGTPLCILNAAQLFRPASNAKLFTTLAALTLLGPTRTFATTVYASPGTPSSPGSASSLHLAGDGDAFLSLRPMPYTKNADAASAPPDPLAVMADAIAASGLLHVSGSVEGEALAWPYEPFAPDWSIDDTVWGYGAPVSALTVYDNKLKVTVTAGPILGSPATASFDPPIHFPNPPMDIFDLEQSVTTVAAKSPASVGIERLPGSNTLRIFGTVAIGAPYTDDLAIPDPALYAAATLSSLLQARGIQIDRRAVSLVHRLDTAQSFQQQVREPLPRLASLAHLPEPRVFSPTLCEGCRVLATHTSPPLLEDVTVTLKVSQNLHAELLLHHLGEAFADDGSIAQGVRVVRQFALDAGVLPSDLILFDGSGLSGHDLVTPRALTQLLAFAARQPWFPSFKAALPLGGVDGSLAARFQGRLQSRVFAKTGTLGESRALSGYITADSGATLIFSILVDNHPPASTADRTATDKIVDIIASQN
jgi:D-alanyl-D-alanine carboxypeptidase/D-alanyl-D-alanine-endopeptidase (penicillin-binding protein 4)